MQVVSHLFLTSREAKKEREKREPKPDGTRADRTRTRWTVALWFGGSLEEEGEEKEGKTRRSICM